jgi:signal peptidase II
LPETPHAQVRARRALPLQFTLVAFLVVALDQLSKLWVREYFAVGESQAVVSGWLDWTHSQNTGAAWSMLAGQRWLLVFVSIGVALLILTMARGFAREAPRRVLPQCALGLIFGGAIGNLIDRIFYGVVTDFIDLGSPINFIKTFPIFNVADCALTIGVILLALHFLTVREDKLKPAAP